MPQDDQQHKEDRVSLAGLDPEEALRALLKVDPESEPADKGARRARNPRKRQQGEDVEPEE